MKNGNRLRSVISLSLLTIIALVAVSLIGYWQHKRVNYHRYGATKGVIAAIAEKMDLQFESVLYYRTRRIDPIGDDDAITVHQEFLVENDESGWHRHQISWTRSDGKIVVTDIQRMEP